MREGGRSSSLILSYASMRDVSFRAFRLVKSVILTRVIANDLSGSAKKIFKKSRIKVWSVSQKAVLLHPLSIRKATRKG